MESPVHFFRPLATSIASTPMRRLALVGLVAGCAPSVSGQTAGQDAASEPTSAGTAAAPTSEATPAAAAPASTAPAQAVLAAREPASNANAVAANAASANASNPNASNPNAAATKPIAWPNIGFVNNPGGNDAKAVALSFDDGPDGLGANQWGKASPSNTTYMLDQLDALKLKATFFLCGNKWSDALTDAQSQIDVRRIVASGHAVGSHTMDHPDLVASTARNIAGNKAGGPPPLTSAQVQAEFVQNEAVFADPRLLGPSLLPFTMYRAPYGYPFQDGIVFPANANSIVDDVTGIAPYAPYNAVHVGWGIDTKDWQCAQAMSDTNCILTNLNQFLDKGASGVILMHAVYKLSGDALPLVVKSIAAHGYHIVQVEDFIKAKYGASSAAIYRANAAAPFDIKTINDAAVAAAKTSKWYLQNNEG